MKRLQVEVGDAAMSNPGCSQHPVGSLGELTVSATLAQHLVGRREPLVGFAAAANIPHQ